MMIDNHICPFVSTVIETSDLCSLKMNRTDKIQ